MSPASIEHLSSDDLLHIFHLCGLHEWVRIEKTSHQWRLLILHEWRQLKRAKLSDLMGLKKESSCEGPFPRHFVRPPLIRYLGLRCGANLKEIYAGDCRLHMEQSCLPVLSQEFPHLRKIDLSNTVFIPSESEFEGSFAPFLQAEHVSLNSCVDDSCSCYYSPDEIDSTLHMILAAVPNVSLVYMSHNTALSGAALFALPSETLTVLDLGFCRRVTDDILSSVFSPLINLTSISLYSNHKITGSCLTHLSEIIRCVDLSYCDSITSENLQNFLQFHHCIDTLKIAHVNSMNNQLLSKLSELPQLKSLTFNSYFRFIFYESQRHPIDIYAGICGLGNLTTLEYLDLR